MFLSSLLWFRKTIDFSSEMQGSLWSWFENHYYCPCRSCKAEQKRSGNCFSHGYSAKLPLAFGKPQNFFCPKYWGGGVENKLEAHNV